MQTAGGGFAGTVTKQDQLVDYKVNITFPGGVQASYSDVTKSVVSVDIQRSVTSNLPDGTSLISGYPSASATVVLSGFLNQAVGVALIEAQSIYWLMNPNDATSPMWRTTRAGLPITIQAGFWDGASTADLVTIFTGTIDQSTCSEGTVTLACRDQRSTITNQAVLPPVITDAPYNAGLTSEFAVDYLARHASPNQYYSWPKQRSNCVLAVSMRSSLWPDVGSYAAYTQAPLFEQGVFGTALTNPGPNLIAYTLTQPILDTQSVFMEAFITGTTGNANAYMEVNDVSGNYGVILHWTPTYVIVYNTSPGGSTGAAGFTLASGSHYVGLLASWPVGSSTANFTLYIDGSPFTFTTAVSDTRPTGHPFVYASFSGGLGTIEGIQVTTETAPASNAGFSPTLVFDAAGSLQPLVGMPDVSTQDTWTALQNIAAAECGVVGFDETGILHFTNRQTVRNKTPVRSITSTASLVTLDSLEQMSLCATHVQVPVNQIQVQPPGIVWQSSTPLQVNPGTPLVFTATLAAPAVNVPTHDSGYFNPSSWSYANAYWMACTTPDGTGAAITAGIAFTIKQLSATQLQVAITNNAGITAYLVSTQTNPGIGTPTVIIGGQFIAATGATVTNNGAAVVSTSGPVIADSQWPPLVAPAVPGGASTGGAVTNATFGEVLLALPANDWCQDLPSALSMADDLVADLFYPKPLYRNLAIVADPRLQMLDRVTIVDTDVSNASSDGLIVGIDTSLSADRWTQTIDALCVTRPGSWVLGTLGYSELSTTTWIY